VSILIELLEFVEVVNYHSKTVARILLQSSAVFLVIKQSIIASDCIFVIDETDYNIH